MQVGISSPAAEERPIIDPDAVLGSVQLDATSFDRRHSGVRTKARYQPPR
jgi:hypothetical protein